MPDATTPPAPPDLLLTGLRAARYRFTFACRSDVHLHAHPGVTLYGALKSVMRPAACVEARYCNGPCRQPQACSYGHLLQTKAPKTNGAAEGFRDAPRPFVLHLSEPARSHYAAGDPLSFDLVLLGEVASYLPQIVQGLSRLSRSGLGNQDEGRRGRVAIASVAVVEPGGTTRTLAGVGQALRAVPRAVPLEQLAGDVAEGAVSRIEISFQTPLRLMHRGKWLNEHTLTPDLFVTRLYHRLRTLARFHGTPLRDDTDAVRAAATEVRFTERALSWNVLARHSASQRQDHPIDGLLGSVVCEGDLAPLLPLLALGQLLHVGSKTAMGLGQYATMRCS